jgi:hypothetical protein
VILLTTNQQTINHLTKDKQITSQQNKSQETKNFQTYQQTKDILLSSTRTAHGDLMIAYRQWNPFENQYNLF